MKNKTQSFHEFIRIIMSNYAEHIKMLLESNGYEVEYIGWDIKIKNEDRKSVV